MNKYEKACSELEKLVTIIEPPHLHRKTGWWGTFKIRDGRPYIFIEPNQSDSDKYEILREEYDHLVTSVGMVLNQPGDSHLQKQSNRRQELIARHLSYKELVTIDDLIDCWHCGLTEPWEIADHLDVSVAFLNDAITYLKGIYPAEFCTKTEYGRYRVIVNGTFHFSKEA